MTPDDTPDARRALSAHLDAFNTAWGAEALRLVASDSAQVVVRLDASIRDAGNTDAGWGSDRAAIGSALVVLRGPERLRDGRVVHHELLHALGAGHTGSWPSAVAAAGRVGAARPTAADVAHAQIVAAVRAVSRQSGASVLIAAP